MVNTRSTAKRNLDKELQRGQDGGHDASHNVSPCPSTNRPDAQISGRMECTVALPGSSIKTEYSNMPPRTPKKPKMCTKSTSSSVQARRKRLELEAAIEKAQIQMELIDKKLAANIALLEDEHYSPHEEGQSCDKNSEVEKWLEKSFQELHKSQLAPECGSTVNARRLPELSAAAQPPVLPDQPAAAHARAPVAAPAGPTPAPALVTPPVCPLGVEPEATINKTVHLLATALNNLSHSTLNNTSAAMLSRLSTPKDLPEFSGDPMEWLQFKQAYQESTEVCKFTDRENLWRLKKCLRGSAKEAVIALFISATSPEKVMSTLELRYGNPDCIISRIIQDLKKLPSLHQEYQRDIVTFAVKVQNFVEAVKAVGRQEYLHGVNIVNIILTKLPTVLVSKWTDYSYTAITESEVPRLEILSHFLTEEARKVSVTASIFTNVRTDYTKKPFQSQMLNIVHETDDKKCRFCRTSIHKLTECKQFRRSLRKTRWQYVKRSRLCYKCLLSSHERDTCPAPVCDQYDCGEAHHRLLHYPVRNREPRPVPGPDRPALREPTPEPTTQNVTHINVNNNKVLLKVVPVRVQGVNGVVASTALLDDGSTVSLISSSLAERAGLRGRQESMRVCGAFNNDELVCETTVVSVNLSGVDNKVHFMRARSIKELNLPVQQLSFIDCNKYSYLHNIKSQLCTVDTKPEILIGQDNCHLLMPLDVKLGKLNEPSATLTPLGWCVHGTVRARSPQRLGRGGRRGSRGVMAGFTPDTTLLLAHHEDGLPAEDDDGGGGGLLREIAEEVRRSFSLDALGISGKPRQNTDDVRAAAHLERTSVLIDSCWYVGLPWKDEDSKMPDSYPYALHRLRGIEHKFKKNSGFADRYKERVKHLLVNDFAKELQESETTQKVWYLPHFGVDNPNKSKLRLVFDAAAKVNGLCLNDYLFTGPDLLSSLFGIMLRFREHKIAVTGDIKDMFLRIKIREQDQHALRFLWKDNPTGDVKTYVMTSLIFGANCSPFVAQFIKNKNAQRFATAHPAAVDAICKSHYMDDYIDSLPDEAEAIEMVQNISDIHKSGGFTICNWTSNSVAVLNSLPQEVLGSAAVKFKIGQQHGGERTLGLIWYPAEDLLGFDVSLKRLPENVIQGKERPTKRLMLRVIMSIFDVLGFLSPFTIQGRIMLQDTWRLNIGWDDFIPADVYIKWCKWLDLLKTISKVRIPRYYQMTARESETNESSLLEARAKETAAEPITVEGEVVSSAPPPHHPLSPLNSPAATQPATSGYDGVADSTSATKPGTDYNNLQLHLFSDASSMAMCAVAYWRWCSQGKMYVSFIASKNRVMPVKPLTIPKAELQAALLAARLAETIEKEHKLTPTARYFWCDSTTVLHWIRNNTRKYKTFEANRLGEIDQLTRVQDWRYIPTKQNVADLATRETFDECIFKGEWFQGPTFLYEMESAWPPDVIMDDPSADSVECVTVTQAVPAALPVPDARRFSSWLRLLRTTAVMLTFIDRCRGLTSSVDCTAMQRAERLLLKSAQAESFSDDLDAMRAGKAIPKDSRLRTLSPFLDEHGVLRAGGRINAAEDVSLETKQPTLLDGRHPVTRLIVRHYHIKAAHGGQEMVVNELKQRYWILRVRPTVKCVASRCMFCRLQKCKPQVPRMGDLPQGRVAHHLRPFTHCGLDLFGPMEVAVGRRREKRYGVLFTCMTVRAIHIELVASLTSDALIMALRRMAARRGWPRYLYSDNGTNLRGACTELKKSVLELDTEALKCEGMNNGTEWTFIPPSSPHWGGAWERQIWSVKTSLKVVLKERAPRDEVLSTLMAEVENIVNSRPLKHVSVEPGSIESLTPNHFLLGSSSNLPIIGIFDNSDLCLRKQWRKVQALADLYWQRWIKEILPELIPRRKWLEEQTPLKEGDLVLVVGPDTPRNMWPKGLVTRVFPGKDGRIRVVEVKTKSGTWRRSAARVAPILLDDECCPSTGVGCVSDVLNKP